MVEPPSPERSAAPARRIAALFAALAGANLLAWGVAFWVFRADPVPLGSCLLAYAFGLRHAVDADHIAAVDNVTRKLMAEGRRPIGVGAFFALGHSSVVMIVSAVLAITAAEVDRFETLRRIGGFVGTIVSSGFLLAIAVANVAVLVDLGRDGRGPAGAGSRPPGETGGLLARLFAPLFGRIRRSWQMVPLGVLFGLGFDTATEIGVIGLSAASAGRGLPIWSIMIFPTLFTAAMTLVDSIDGVLMMGAYGWTFDDPIRGFRYNTAMTALSAVLALAVGGLELVGAIGDHLGLDGGGWAAVAALDGHFDVLGLAAVATFGLAWLAAAAWGRRRATS